MLEHACHLPGGGRHTGNRHNRMLINFQNLIRPIRPLRRNSEGKSSATPEKFWSNPDCERSITDPCAGDSAWIGWDRLCAFFLTDPLCPVAKHPANADHRHRIVLGPTEPVPLAFECAQA